MSMKLKSSNGTKTVPEMTDLWQMPGKQIISTDVADLDTLTTPGLYQNAHSSGIANRPLASNAGGAILVVQTVPDAVTQVYFAASVRIFIRRIVGGSPSTWREISITDIT